MLDLELIRQEAKKELARRFFYDYCTLKYPKLYTPDRTYLKEMCTRIQAFIEQNEKRFLIVDVPPRHLKSLTGTNLVEWLFGLNTMLKVMTGSYNETLSTTFASKVRDTIEEQPVQGGGLVYGDIFPKTKVQYGKASKSLWGLQGSGQDNYLATSPTGTATGFGAQIVLLDDIIRNAEEAYNETILQKHFDWFSNTLMQRTEGDSWKFIVIMTRWAEGDLAGRIIEAYGDDVEVIIFKAVQDDGSMLCDSILNKHDYLLKTKEMNPDIVEANYNQKPIDVKGRLFHEFTVYDTLPTLKLKKFNYTDTADKGMDFLCSVDYVVHEHDVYITDLVMSDQGMEETEPEVAAMLDADEVDEATFESNNGGRGYARNIERLLLENHGNTKCVVKWVAQTANKEARILASSAWVNQHVYMPRNWKGKYPEFYRQVMNYQRKGRNRHDDGPDVLAALYEKVANPSRSVMRVRRG